MQQVDRQPITLGELSDIRLEESPPTIEHEAGRRRTFVQVNVRNRDVASFVQEAQRRIGAEVEIPPGYSLQWGGDFENLRSAGLRLSLITPLVLLLIWILLYTSFKSIRLALLIFLAVPLAASGGVFALALRDLPFSISAGVGFVALFGVAVLNGLVWVSGAEHLRVDGIGPASPPMKPRWSAAPRADDRPGRQPGVPADGHLNHRRRRDPTSSRDRRDRRPDHLHPAHRRRRARHLPLVRTPTLHRIRRGQLRAGTSRYARYGIGKESHLPSLRPFATLRALRFKYPFKTQSGRAAAKWRATAPGKQVAPVGRSTFSASKQDSRP